MICPLQFHSSIFLQVKSYCLWGLVAVLGRSAHVASFPLFPFLYFNRRSLGFWQMFQLKTFKPLSSWIYASPSNFTIVHDRQFNPC